MPVRDIRAKIGIDGEKEFTQAVTEAGRSMRVMASEMKAATAEFDLSGDKMEYLGKRSKILNQQIEQQEVIIRALEGAVEDAADKYGEAGAKTDAYRIKLNNAQTAMAKLKKELEESNREMAELGRDAGRVGRQLEEGIGDAADDVSKKIESMANTIDQDLSDIGKSVDFSAFKDKFDFAKDVISDVGGAIFDLTEGTEDYRRTMSFLEQNALTAGMDPEVIKNMTFEVSALTGELDGAVEGMSNLMAAGFESDELSLAVERLSAAVIQFPDTLKFESLADSLQESVATAQATGQYAEYLERMGVDLDTVNKSFENAAKKGPEAVEAVALAWLENPSAEKALEFYKEMNQDLIDGQLAQAKWNDEVARTADILQPYVTRLTELGTAMLGRFNDAISFENKGIWWLPDSINDMLGFGEAEASQMGENSGIFAGLQKGFESAMKKASEWLDGIFSDSDVEAAEQNTEAIGKNLVISLGDGLDGQKQQLTYQAAMLFRAIEAELNKEIQGPTVKMNNSTSASGTYKGSTTQNTNVQLSMDGKMLGSVTLPYTDQAYGEKIDRYEMYG